MSHVLIYGRNDMVKELTEIFSHIRVILKFEVYSDWYNGTAFWILESNYFGEEFDGKIVNILVTKHEPKQNEITYSFELKEHLGEDYVKQVIRPVQEFFSRIK